MFLAPLKHQEHSRVNGHITFYVVILWGVNLLNQNPAYTDQFEFLMPNLTGNGWLLKLTSTDKWLSWILIFLYPIKPGFKKQKPHKARCKMSFLNCRTSDLLLFCLNYSLHIQLNTKSHYIIQIEIIVRKDRRDWSTHCLQPFNVRHYNCVFIRAAQWKRYNITYSQTFVIG